jgi:hypothetical protein
MNWRCVLNNRRRSRRFAYLGPLSIFWENERGQAKYLRAKFLDISERGLRVEIPEPVPVGAYVSLRADRIILSGSAVVRHVERCGAKYFLGLELSALLKEQAFALFREPVEVKPVIGDPPR